MQRPPDFESGGPDSDHLAPESWDATAPEFQPRGAAAAPYSVGWVDEVDDAARAKEARANGLPPPASPARTFEPLDSNTRAEKSIVPAPHGAVAPGQTPSRTASQKAPPSASQQRRSAESADAAPPLKIIDAPPSSGALEETPASSPIILSSSASAAAVKGKSKRQAAPRSGPATIVRLPHSKKLDLFPALFSRSALFRVSGSDDPAVEQVPTAAPIAIKAQGGLNITLSGPWPRMRDKEVWEAALQMAKAAQNVAEPIPVSLSSFAKRLGCSSKGGATLEWIWTSLSRLALCRIEFDSQGAPGGRAGGCLLTAARMSGRRREIEIDPVFFGKLLEDDYQFALDRPRRAALSTALARWLHDFLSTHATAKEPFELPYLRELCGFGADKKRFPAALEEALKELSSKAPGILATYSIHKPSKSSDEWTVELIRGDEKHRFEQPKAKAPTPNPNPQRRAAPRRGGVQL